MAKRKSKFTKALFKVFNIKNADEDNVTIVDDSYRSISNREMKKMLKEVYVYQPNTHAPIDKLQVPSMLDPISRELVDRRVDHEKLMALAPEIGQAASIIVPSILTPNDFSKNIFSVIVEGDESDAVKTAVTKILQQHFDNDLGLSIKLSKWVEDAMFSMGGKPIMILPTGTIANLRDGISSTESLEASTSDFIHELDGSLESISVSDIQKKVLDDEEIVDRVFATGTFTELKSYQEDDAKIRNFRVKVKNGVKAGLKYFSEKDVLKFSDDPRYLLKNRFSSSAALEAIDTKVFSKLGEIFPGHKEPQIIRSNPKEGIAGQIDKTSAVYNYLPYVDLSDYIFKDSAGDFPAMIELPYEAVIPIIVEGAPTNHVGYFIIINETGNPVTINSDSFDDYLSSVAGSQRVNNLYSAFYGQPAFSVQRKMSTDAKMEVLNSIYDSFIKGMMHTRLEKMGLSKHRVELASSISKVMFARLLKSAETRVVFVPKRLMMYLAYQYNNDGTGRSKIENIKFPLSLKMTLIVTRLISLIESSINRRTLNISLDKNIGNPLELLRSIKKEFVSNKVYSLSYDPDTIIKNTLDKELTIVPDKIPGVESFSITDTANNVDYPKPDDAILEEINNMYMMSLDVPPSAMNRLKEEEYSRSVASNNVFFSNKLVGYQKPTCSFMTDLIVTYTQFSKKLKEQLINVLKSETESVGALEGKEENVEGDTSNDTFGEGNVNKVSIDRRFIKLLNSIRFTLPSPTLAHDKSSFADLKEFIEIVDTVLNSVFSDDLVLDQEIAGVIKILRANTRREILQAHIKGNSMLGDLNFDVLGNVDIVDINETNQKIMHVQKSLLELVKVFNEAPADNSGGDGGSIPTNW